MPPGTAGEEAQKMLAALDREALESERLRAAIVAGICAFLSSSFFLLSQLAGERIELIRRHPTLPRQLVLMTGLFVVYELLLWRFLTRVMRRGVLKKWRHLRYLNIVIESSLPSVLVYFFVNTMHGAYGLLMPPTSLYYFFIIVSSLRLDFNACLFTGAVASVEYLLLWKYGTTRYHGPPLEVLLVTPFHHLAKALSFLFCGLAAGVVTTQLKKRVTRSLRLIAEHNRVTAMFGRYVSPAVVDRLLEERAELDGELRHVCVLFLDIRNFTRFSESRTPHEVVSYLNALFAFMIEIVSKHNGIINKFLGDGFMAIFGAPLPDERACQHAVEAALEIVQRLAAELASEQLPATRIGIGVHFGPALTGSIGSPRRKEYTVIGDTVNLASRIEQLTKQFDAQVLASGSVIAAIDDRSLFAERLGEVAVRGRQAPLEIYRLA